MAEERVGSVRFRGDPNTLCDEAREYTEEGSAVLSPGQELEGIPEERLVGFLMNANFEPNDPVSEEVNERLLNRRTRRADGSVIRRQDSPESEFSEKPLEDQTLKELKVTADRVGVEVKSSDNKTDIIEKIRASEQPDGGAQDSLSGTTESQAAPPLGHEDKGSDA